MGTLDFNMKSQLPVSENLYGARPTGPLLLSQTLTIAVLLSAYSILAQTVPTITTISNEPICSSMGWTGGTGMMMLQKKVNLSDLQWVNMCTTSNDVLRVPKVADSGFFRLQS